MTKKEAQAIADQFTKDCEGSRYSDTFIAEKASDTADDRWVVTRKREGHPDMRVAG